MTHICVSKQSIIGSDNGLSPGRRQAIIWTNAGILLIGPLGTNFSENLIEILTFSFMKMRLKASSAKWRPFCLGLNVLRKQCLREGGRSATHRFLCYWRVHLLLAGSLTHSDKAQWKSNTDLNNACAFSHQSNFSKRKCIGDCKDSPKST